MYVFQTELSCKQLPWFLYNAGKKIKSSSSRGGVPLQQNLLFRHTHELFIATSLKWLCMAGNQHNVVCTNFWEESQFTDSLTWWVVEGNVVFRLKKINSMSQSCHMHFVFRCAFDHRPCVWGSVVWFSKIQGLNFFCLLNFFFPIFYELAGQNIQEKIWQTQGNTLNRLFQLCVLSCI